MNIISWFTRDKWHYLLTGGEYSKGRGCAGFSWRALWCRATGHRDMVWFCHGLEPDTHCRNCGDDLG